MKKSPNQAIISGRFCRPGVALITGMAIFLLAGASLAGDVSSANMVKISKDNVNAKLAAEFQKYLQTGSPDAMCEFGMEDHGSAFTAQSAPRIIGASKKPQLTQNKNLTWQVFSQSAVVTEQSNIVKR